MNHCKQCDKPIPRLRNGGRYILATEWGTPVSSRPNAPLPRGGKPFYLCSWACVAKFATTRHLKLEADRMARQDEDREPEPSAKEREAEVAADSGDDNR